MTVIEQELERDNSYKTYFYIAEELKWRLVESLSEGGNHKIRKKVSEVRSLYKQGLDQGLAVSEEEMNDINSLFDFVLTTKNSDIS